MSHASNYIDLNAPDANMFGIQPCPKCKSERRSMLKSRPGEIICDDCGHSETAENPEELA